MGLISATQWCSRWFNIQCFPIRCVGLRLKYETYSFYIAPCNVLQYAANQTRNTRAAPSLYCKCTGFFYVRHTTHGTNGFTSHPNDEAMVKCLASEHRCHDWDSDPHSADQKHQNLNPMLLTTPFGHDTPRNPFNVVIDGPHLHGEQYRTWSFVLCFVNEMFAGTLWISLYYYENSAYSLRVLHNTCEGHNEQDAEDLGWGWCAGNLSPLYFTWEPFKWILIFGLKFFGQIFTGLNYSENADFVYTLDHARCWGSWLRVMCWKPLPFMCINRMSWLWLFKLW